METQPASAFDRPGALKLASPARKQSIDRFRATSCDLLPEGQFPFGCAFSLGKLKFWIPESSAKRYATEVIIQMKRLSFATVLASLAMLPAAHAIKIELRYDYDTAGFFTTHPQAKIALRKVADYYETLFHDSLLPINGATYGAGNTWKADFFHPGTGVYVGIPNLVVPADTLIVFAGGRNLGGSAGQGGPGGFSQLTGNTQAWINTVVARGQPGALATPKTDFGPWGGSVTFNTTETWSFSTTTPEDDLVPFTAIALHEFGHLLGIGTAQSWTAKISGGVFTGAHSGQSHGGPVPIQSGGGHWRDDGQCTFPDGYDPDEPNNVLNKAYGSFGTPHGLNQIALMDPSSCSVGPFLKVMTDLDLAGLRDIGWQLDPPLYLTSSTLKPSAGPFQFSWPSSTGFTYRLQRGTNLSTDWTTLSTQTGNGLTLQHTSPVLASAPRVFYRLTTVPPPPAAFAAFPPAAPVPTEQPAVIIGDCRCRAASHTD